MSGLKLQVLSNPSLSGSSPSFVIGNPQVVTPRRAKKRGIAKKAGKRENGSMAKHRRRRNPFPTYAGSGVYKRRVGVSLTKPERLERAKVVLAIRQELKAPGLSKASRKKGKAALRRFQKDIAKEKKHFAKVKKLAGKYQARGYEITGGDAISHEEAGKIKTWKNRFKKRKRKGKPAKRKARKAHAKKKFGFIGTNSKGEMLIRKKNGVVITVKRKRKGRKAKKAKSTRKKSRRKDRKPRKGRKARRKYQKHHKASRKPRKARRKARKTGKRRKSKKYWARRHHSGHVHVSLRRLGKSKKRRGTVRRGKKKYHYSMTRKNPYRRNPFGGSMGKALDFVTAGDPKEAGYILAAAATSEVLAASILKIPGLGSVFAMLNTSLTGVSPALAAAVVPILPTFLAALAAEAVGQKTGKKAVQDFGKALMITNIVDLGEAIGATLSSATGLAGVAYTPMGRHKHLARRPGMRGVDYTMSAVPRGLGAVPRGLHGLTRHDNSDFGGVDFTMGSRQQADFGGENLMTPAGMVSTAADFGRMGAVPSMRGAHTGDVMYPDPQTDPDGNTIDLDESNDHMT